MSLALTEHDPADAAASATSPAPAPRRPAGPVPAGAGADLIPFDDYVAYRPNLFPSMSRARKFLKVHGRDLIQEGALFRLFQRYMVEPRAFDAFVMRVARQTASAVVIRR